MKVELGEDLIVEILVRLPVKSILQCKCLSKHYYSLIGSPLFINRHKRLVIEEDEHDMLVIRSGHDGQEIHKFFRRTGNTEPLDYRPTFLAHKRFSIHGFSSSGPLAGICCVFLDSWERGDIILWNPTTREHHLLPPLPRYLQKPPDDKNLVCPHMSCGFGFDRNRNDYKVVLVTSYTSYDKRPSVLTSRTFNLYSTLDQEWRMVVDIDGDDKKPCDWIGSSSVYVNETCHWMSHTKVDDRCYSIITFDMSRDVVGSLPLPVGSSDYKWSHPYIVSLNESLALVNAHGSNFDLWVMKDYGVIESWTLLYQVSSPMRMKKARFLGIVGDHFYLRKDHRSWAISYDLRSGDVKRYDIEADDIDCILPYVPTLTRINSDACALQETLSKCKHRHIFSPYLSVWSRLT